MQMSHKHFNHEIWTGKKLLLLLSFITEDGLYDEQLEKHTIVTSWQNSNNAATGEVNLMMKNNAEDTLAEVSKFNDRILIAHFSENPKNINQNSLCPL